MRGRIAKKICNRTHLSDLCVPIKELKPYTVEQICTAFNMYQQYHIRKLKKRSK